MEPKIAMLLPNTSRVGDKRLNWLLRVFYEMSPSCLENYQLYTHTKVDWFCSQGQSVVKAVIAFFASLHVRYLIQCCASGRFRVC